MSQGRGIWSQCMINITRPMRWVSHWWGSVGGVLGDCQEGGVEVGEGGGGLIVRDEGGLVFHEGDGPVFAEEGVIVAAEEKVAFGGWWGK